MGFLEKGDKAPNFKFEDEDGRIKMLSDYLGSRVIIYFYPKDDTPGCTAQACNLRDGYSLLNKLGVKIIGVSADSEKKHTKFKEKYQLPFVLVADEEKEVIEKYGVWGRKKFMGREFDGIIRTTYIIGVDGNIEFRIDKVKTKEHTTQIIELLNNIN